MERIFNSSCCSFTYLEAFLIFLLKRSGDLQWKLLHCALPTNSHVCKFNLNLLPSCIFFSLPESVFHVFTECSRLVPLFIHC